MDIKKLTYRYLVVTLAVVLCACTANFEEYNTDPLGITDEMMQYDGLKYGAPLAQMQINVFPISQQPRFGDERYQVVQNLCADIFSGYMAAPRYWYKDADNTVYALYPSWYSQHFDHAFTNIMAPWNELRKSTEEDTQPQIFAIAQIIKVEAMHRVTDMYGPLPYSGFGKQTQVNYDSQEAIYDSFFADLDGAVNILNEFIQGNPGGKILQYFDYIYGGDPVKWVKFANSLRLRLALHIVYAAETKAKTQAEAALDPGRGGVFTENSDMAVLKSGPSVSFHHPLWEICENFNDISMGAAIDCYMNGYKDPRIGAYFQLPVVPSATASLYRGVRTCIDIGADSESYKKQSSKIMASPNNDHSIVWMGTSEVYFLRAEAKLRWPSLAEPMSVQDLYDTGVAKSMEWWKVSVGDYLTEASTTRIPTTYSDPVKVTQSALSRPSSLTVPWSEAATTAQQLERICIQKWLAVYPDGMEGWTEYRRSGYPVLIPGDGNVNKSAGTIPNTGPLRMPFPSSEYLGNSAGVATGVALLNGSDHGGTKLWWDKN